MEKLKFKELETERLILKQINKKYIYEMFEGYCHDEKVCEFMPWQPYKKAEDIKKYVKHSLKKCKKEGFIEWLLISKETNKVLGAISVRPNDEGVYTMGYCLGSQFWGNGLMPEAASEVVKYVFENSPTERIEAIHDTENAKSGRVMQKIGMTHEGTLRHYRKHHGKFVDMEMYSILRGDYESRL